MEVGSGAILIPTRIALDPRHRHDVEKGVSLRTAHRLLSLGALLTASAALAQIATSTLTGTVIDTSTRAPVPDVVVTATLPSLQGEQVVVTDASGLYRVPQPIYAPHREQSAAPLRGRTQHQLHRQADLSHLVRPPGEPLGLRHSDLGRRERIFIGSGLNPDFAVGCVSDPWIEFLPNPDPTTFTGICFLTKPFTSLTSDPGDVGPDIGTTIWNTMICSRR